MADTSLTVKPYAEIHGEVLTEVEPKWAYQRLDPYSQHVWVQSETDQRFLSQCPNCHGKGDTSGSCDHEALYMWLKEHGLLEETRIDGRPTLAEHRVQFPVQIGVTVPRTWDSDTVTRTVADDLYYEVRYENSKLVITLESKNPSLRFAIIGTHVGLEDAEHYDG